MKHEHKEKIIAWLNGAECEFYSERMYQWCEIDELSDFVDYAKVRIKPEPQKKQELQYLYIYRDTSNNISVYHAMMVEKFNHFYYLGKVRVEK